MKVTVLLGSPRGQRSGSRQMAQHAEQVAGDGCEFTYLDLGRQHQRLLGDEQRFDEACAAIAGADAILWAIPAYCLFVSAQLKTVLDAIVDRRLELFHGKHCAALMTSIRLGDDRVLDALRHREHPTHFNVDQALAAVAALKPRRALLTHISHDLDHQTTSDALPPHVDLAYDGLVPECE